MTPTILLSLRVLSSWMLICLTEHQGGAFRWLLMGRIVFHHIGLEQGVSMMLSGRTAERQTFMYFEAFHGTAVAEGIS